MGLQLFEGPDAAEISEAMMKTGAILARWYADEWLRVTSVPRVPRLNLIAKQVLDWLRRNFQPDGKTFTARSIYRAQAGNVRSRQAAEEVLSLLRAQIMLSASGKFNGSLGDTH